MKRIVAISVLTCVYSGVVILGKLFSVYRRPIKNRSNIILVNGTFHNPNWLHAHLTPLAKAGFDKVILVTDHPLDSIESMVYQCPPRLLQNLLSRAGAKFLWTIYCGFKYKPDLYMGYHIFPAAISALLVAKMFNRPSCFQDTSGPLELEGGGWHAENTLLVALQRPSIIVEKSVNAVVRLFDLVIVRGSKAGQYIRKIGNNNAVEVITGSVVMPISIKPIEDRDIDVIFVGRLTEYKRPDRFLKLIKKVKKKIPNIRVVVVGDGPDFDDLNKMALEYKIGKNVEFLGKRKDVLELLSNSKIYALTSRWEGVSIAMIEAMSNGTVPVVTDVGDLSDYVTSGISGYIHAEEDIDGMANSIQCLLSNNKLYTEQSIKCNELIRQRSSVEAISNKWNHTLNNIITSYK